MSLLGADVLGWELSNSSILADFGQEPLADGNSGSETQGQRCREQQAASARKSAQGEVRLEPLARQHPRRRRTRRHLHRHPR